MSRKKTTTAAKTPPKPQPEATKGSGRPPGSPNAQYDEVEVQVVACRRCGSTERSPYFGIRRFPYCGEKDGRPYNRIVWRSCRCLQCGQHRREKTFEQSAE